MLLLKLIPLPFVRRKKKKKSLFCLFLKQATFRKMESLLQKSYPSLAFATPNNKLFHTSANHNPSSCSFLRRNRIICSQDRENATSMLTMPNSPVDMTPLLTDIAINGGMRTTTTTTPTVVPGKDSFGGLGIVQYLEGKNYFITGATGFLAKIFIEKMLRSVPDVGKIFLLIKADDKEAAMDRLQNEIIDSELFECLKQMHGKSYKAFMRSKLIPVVGNVCEPNLGMDDESASEISKEVNVIVNSAANTTFDERYEVALNTNTKGPSRLMSVAKKCNKLDLFLHISTAYVNGERQGIVTEKPFCMGETIAAERGASESGVVSSFPVLDIEAEIKLASNFLESVHQDNSSVAAQKMKQLGLERANANGWQNTYVFTKSMGEMLLNSMRGEVPVVIIRPSVVESTYKEPFPGWIQGNRMLDPLILSYGKGQLPGFIMDPKAAVDVVPADMVVNAMMAAMAKHGGRTVADKTTGLKVYHVASSVVNPLLFGDVFRYSREYFTTSPLLMNSDGRGTSIDAMKYLSNMEDFSSYIENEILVRESGGSISQASNSKFEMKCKKKADHVIHMAKIYEPYTFYKGWFNNNNTQRLMEAMSEEEKSEFGFDVRGVDWKDYMLNIHIPGLRRHIIKRALPLST